MDLNLNNCGCLSMLKMENVSLALAFIHWPLRIAINKAHKANLHLEKQLNFSKKRLQLQIRSPTGTDLAV